MNELVVKSLGTDYNFPHPFRKTPFLKLLVKNFMLHNMEDDDPIVI